jgi:hypothetical protein
VHLQAAGCPARPGRRSSASFQRDWNRTETVKAFVEILFDSRVPFVAAERAAV